MGGSITSATGGHASSGDLCSEGGWDYGHSMGSVGEVWGRLRARRSLPTCPKASYLLLHALRKQHQDAGLDGQGDVPAQLLQVNSQ